MRRAKCFFLLIFLICSITLAGQSRSQLREMFVSAQGDLLFEDYAEALPKYLSLLQIYPENYNLYFRIGQCYLNTPGEKDKAIDFLETAAQNINPDYRLGKFRETGAPYDVLYFLANAYRVNNDFEKAVQTYELFLKDVDTRTYDTALVRFQIQTCNNAPKMMRKPSYIVSRNLGSSINERFSEFNPVISANENTLLFTRELQFYDAIFWSEKVNGTWSEPVNLTPQLGIDQDYYTSSLSGDGKTLLLYRTDTYDGNIYLSKLEGSTWSNVKKLNGNINTKYWESHAVMAKDGRKIYFTSNRRESLGGLDIFVSERDSTGDWGPAVNLGPTINTIYDEDTPFITNNDSTLFFSSRGHYNMGGYDIFRSDLGENGQWEEPVNIGYPLNTADDDIFFMPVGKGNRGYMSRFTDDGYGRMDIFSYDIYSDLNPRNFIVTGRASVSNLLDEFPQPVKITAINNTYINRVVTALTNPVTGLYSFRLPQGSYSISFESEDAVTRTQNHDIPIDHKGDTIRIETVTLEETDTMAFLKLLCDTLIDVSGDKPVNISMIAEERSLLDIKVLSSDSVINSEQHRLTDTSFTYTFLPREGESKVSFLLTDRFGNEAEAAVKVKRSTVATARLKPLYREIPVPPPDIQADEIITSDNLAEKDTAPAGLEGVETLEHDDAKDEKQGRLWWLLLLPAVVILLLIWKRRKNRKTDKDQ
jgi:hypothetical protein